MGDSRYLPFGVTKRQLTSDTPGKTRRQIGGPNGANVLEQVVNAIPSPNSDQLTPFTTDDEQFIYFVGNSGSGSTYQIQRFGVGSVSNPAQPGTAVPVAISNEPGADHLFPVVNPAGNRIVFAKSTDGLPVGNAAKVWHLYASNLPSSGTLSTTPPGATNLIALTLNRSFRGRAFATVGRACWIGTNDILFSARLQGETNFHLFSVNTTTLTVFQVTDGPADERNPAISPDGRSVAFDSNAAPSVAGTAYSGGTNPRTETVAGDPAVAAAVNASGRRNIFVSGIYGGGAIQFTNRYAGAADTDNVQPSFSTLRQNPYTNASGQNIYLAFASTRQPDVPGAPTTFTDGGTYDIYMVRASTNAGTTLQSEQAPTNLTQGAKLVDAVDATYAYNDNYPTWSPVATMTRFAFQSDRTGGLLTNNFGDGFTATPGTNDIFLGSALDVSAPTLIRYDTNSTTGEIVHINQGTTYNAGQSVRTRDNGLLPGQDVFFTVRVDDRESGIGRVFLQFKNPNSYFQAQVQGGAAREHKEYVSLNSGPYVFQEGNPPTPLYWRNQTNGRSVGIENEAEVVSLDGTQYFRHRATGGPVYDAGSDDQLAFSGVNFPALDGQGGRPNCWLELQPLVDQDGNPVLPTDGRGGVLYGATWRLPAEASDWFIDVILYDNAVHPYPTGANTRSNWIIYDNVWGFSTALPINAAEKDVLFVSDYTLGQKFFISRPGQLVGSPDNRIPIQFGAESYWTDSDMARFPSEQAGQAAAPAPGATDLRLWDTGGPWFRNTGFPSGFRRTDPRTGVVVNPGTPNPLGVGSYCDELIEYGRVTASNGVTYALPETGRYSIWRVLSRGPVPAELLQSYLPISVTQPADTRVNETTSRSVKVWNRLVVWSSPFSGNLFVGPGAITDLRTQQLLSQFVNGGGRLFISGQDIGFSLAGNGQTNDFFTNVLRARYTADDNGGAASVNGVGATRFNSDAWPSNTHAYGETTDGATYNYLAANGRPALLNSAFVATTGIADASRTSDTSGLARLDVVAGLAGTTGEFAYNNSGNPGIISSTFTGGGAVFFASFGFESIGYDWYTWTPAGGGTVRIANRGTRAKIMANYTTGFRTGTFTGRLIDEQGSPVPDALVRAIAAGGSEAQAAAGTAITDAGGFFQIDGLAPNTYAIYGYKPGYYTQHTAGDVVHGAGRRNISLVLKRANPGKLTHIPPTTAGASAGVMALDKTTAIPNIEVQARRINPDGRVSVFTALSRDASDARFPAGSYELKDLLIGEYEIIANAPDTYDVTGALVPNPNYNAGYGTVKVTATAAPNRFALGTGTTVVDRNGRSVLVIDEDRNAQIDFYLPSAPQPVSGKVLNANTGDGIEGAFVTAISDETKQVVATGTTDKDGNYTLTTTGTPSTDRLVAGGYTLTASALGYSTATTTLAVTGLNPIVAPTLRLTPLPPGSVSGLANGIVGGGISGASVKFYLNQGGVVATTPTYTTTTTGVTVNGSYSYNFKLDGVAAGKYVVTVEKAGLVADPIQLTIDVASGAEKRNVNFRLLPPAVYGDGLQLVSTPFDYSGSLPREIFGITPTGDNNGDGLSGTAADVAIYNQFIVADWTGVDYNIGPNVPINTGKGYFVRFGAITSVAKTGNALPGSTFTLTMAPGWNLVGHPFANATNPTAPGPELNLYNHASIVDEDGTTYTLTQAVQQNLVRGVLFGYTGSNNGSQYYETTVMKAWTGYWFRNATTRSLKLVLRYPDTRSVQRMAPKTIRLADLQAPKTRSIESRSLTDWRLQIAARQGSLLDSDNSIGVAPDAKDGFDSRYDNEKPPMLTQAPSVYVGIDGVTESGRATSFADVVRSAGAGTKSWNITVEAGQDGEITLYWPNINRLPRGLDPILVDVATGRRVAMRSSGSLRIPHAGRVQHRYRIEVGPAQTAPLALTRVRVQSSGGRGSAYRISFTATREAEVAADIQTLNGRTLRRFQTRAQGAAETTILWDGRDASGAPLPAGTYVLNVTAQDDTGRIARQRLPIGTVR